MTVTQKTSDYISDETRNVKSHAKKKAKEELKGILHQRGFSELCSWTTSSSKNWELVTDANSQALLQALRQSESLEQRLSRSQTAWPCSSDNSRVIITSVDKKGFRLSL